MKREGKENTGEVNKEGGEEEDREGKSLEYSVYLPPRASGHIYSERLTYDGKDEGIREIVVERDFHIVLSLTQCPSCVTQLALLLERTGLQ